LTFEKVKGQGHESQKNIAGVGLCTPVSAGFFWVCTAVYVMRNQQ